MADENTNTGNVVSPPTSVNMYKSRGEGRGFEAGKYDIKDYSYPSDLMSNVYGDNYVIFYINVAIDSKLVKEGKALFVEDIDPRDRGDLIAMDLNKKQVVGTSTALGAVGGTVLGGMAGAGGGSGGAAGGAYGAVLSGAVATQAASFSRSQKRLKTAIALHIPNQLNIRYGMQWSDEDTAAFAGMAKVGTEAVKAVATAGKGSNLTGTVGAVAANVGLSAAPGAAAMSAASGLAANPKKEQVFKGVDYRTFQFEYQFFPRDEVEARNVLNIIEQFKYHMHPEFKDSDNFLYIYPSEFDVYYYQGSSENRNIHRHTSCVLTEMNINYTPNGSFTTFANGMPTQINVQMTFKELALLTKDKIKDGM